MSVYSLLMMNKYAANILEWQIPCRNQREYMRRIWPMSLRQFVCGFPVNEPPKWLPIMQVSSSIDGVVNVIRIGNSDKIGSRFTQVQKHGKTSLPSVSAIQNYGSSYLGWSTNRWWMKQITDIPFGNVDAMELLRLLFGATPSFFLCVCVCNDKLMCCWDTTKCIRDTLDCGIVVAVLPNVWCFVS
jgi:hypothetical protein